MPSLSINQDERLVGAQATQRCRIDVVGSVGAGLTVGVKRGG